MRGSEHKGEGSTSSFHVNALCRNLRGCIVHRAELSGVGHVLKRHPSLKASSASSGTFSSNVATWRGSEDTGRRDWHPVIIARGRLGAVVSTSNGFHCSRALIFACGAMNTLYFCAFMLEAHPPSPHHRRCRCREPIKQYPFLSQHPQ